MVHLLSHPHSSNLSLQLSRKLTWTFSTLAFWLSISSTNDLSTSLAICLRALLACSADLPALSIAWDLTLGLKLREQLEFLAHSPMKASVGGAEVKVLFSLARQLAKLSESQSDPGSTHWVNFSAALATFLTTLAWC